MSPVSFCNDFQDEIQYNTCFTELMNGSFQDRHFQKAYDSALIAVSLFLLIPSKNCFFRKRVMLQIQRCVHWRTHDLCSWTVEFEITVCNSCSAVCGVYLFVADAQAVTALCRSTRIQHVVYVSCKADSPNTVSNFIQLCDKGQFSLDHVVPVDLFPHTLHTELVLVFSR